MPTEARTARRRPQQERARESRERILAAAAQLFAEYGITAVSTNRIAQHAHMSIGTLYRYFNDKDEIVAELRHRTLTQLEERFTAAVLGGLSLEPADSIAAGLRGVVEALVERQGLVRALAAEATLEGSGLEEMERRLLLLTRAYLLHRLGPRSDEELDSRAFLMVSVGLAASLRIALNAPASLDRDRLVDETARMLAAWLDT